MDRVEVTVRAIRAIAHAITPLDAAPNNGVGSLTEAVMLVGENAGRIADALSDIASAIREGRE